jgi:hypothetical protein
MFNVIVDLAFNYWMDDQMESNRGGTARMGENKAGFYPFFIANPTISVSVLLYTAKIKLADH